MLQKPVKLLLFIQGDVCTKVLPIIFSNILSLSHNCCYFLVFSADNKQHQIIVRYNMDNEMNVAALLFISLLWSIFSCTAKSFAIILRPNRKIIVHFLIFSINILELSRNVQSENTQNLG